MVSTVQLLLALLVAGVVGTTSANERAKRDIPVLQPLVTGIRTPVVTNTILPPKIGLPLLNPQVPVNPKPPSINPSLSAGVVAASEEPGSLRNRYLGYNPFHKKGSHEKHSTGSHSAEGKGKCKTHKPQYGVVMYHGSHSGEGKEHPYAPVVHIVHPAHGGHTKPGSYHHKPYSNKNIHHGGSGSHEGHSSYGSSSSSSSSSSDSSD